MQRLSAYPVHPFAEYYDTPFYPHPQLLAYPQLHTVTHAPYLFTTFPEYHGPPMPSTEAHGKHLADRTSVWISDQQKIPYTPDPAGLSPHLEDANKTQQDKLNAIFPLDNEQTLPQPQREAFYQSLSDVLPPACGIEESVGTYKAFMTQQVQGYYDRLVSGNITGHANVSSVPHGHELGIVPSAASVVPAPVSYPVSAQYPRIAFPVPLSQSPASVTPVPSNSEFSSWLLYIGHSQASSIAPSPSQTPSLSETGTSASSVPWAPELSQEHSRGESGVPSLEINEILSSPVLRSRHTTYNIHDDTRSLKSFSKTHDDGIISAATSLTRKKLFPTLEEHARLLNEATIPLIATHQDLQAISASTRKLAT